MKLAGLLALLICVSACQTPTTPHIGQTAPAPAAIHATPATSAKPAPGRSIGVVADTGWREELQPGARSLTASRASTGSDATFEGTARKAAKISLVGSPSVETSLARLIAELEESDASMRNHVPPISSAASSRRIDEEMRNVTVSGWVHFAKVEEDNDYHLIVGTTPNLRTARFLNVEVSGLPPHNASSYGRLKQARDEFESVFGDAMRSGGYTQFEPTHVFISGSLFYDIDHPAGVVGPSGYRPQTAWEIHPVSALLLAE